MPAIDQSNTFAQNIEFRPYPILPTRQPATSSLRWRRYRYMRIRQATTCRKLRQARAEARFGHTRSRLNGSNATMLALFAKAGCPPKTYGFQRLRCPARNEAAWKYRTG